MAFSATIQHAEKPVQPVSETPNNDLSDALFSMVILSVYGAQMSKKTLRKMKRQFFWTSLKLKAKSAFQPKQSVSDRTLIYILLGIALIALVILAPVAALVLAILALILILAGVI